MFMFWWLLLKNDLMLRPTSILYLQILSLILFEKIPLDQLLMNSDYQNDDYDFDNQLNLFDNLTGH